MQRKKQIKAFSFEVFYHHFNYLSIGFVYTAKKKETQCAKFSFWNFVGENNQQNGAYCVIKLFLVYLYICRKTQCKFVQIAQKTTWLNMYENPINKYAKRKCDLQKNI